MHKNARIALAILLLILSIPRATGAQSACTYDFSEVTALMENAVATVPLAGASMLIIKDNRIVYERYFGNYTADTTVLIASASKWLSGAALMTLVDEGKLSLNDPASKYLPYLTGTKATITLRQMFSHSSGFPGIADDAPCIGNPLVSMDACTRQIANLDLIGPPGGQFAYGENSMQIAGRVCEVASGKSWGALFQEKIAGPLEMPNTNFGPNPNPIIAGGGRSRLHEYANFLRMIMADGQFNGKRVLSAEAVREMGRTLTDGMPVASSPRNRTEVDYGIGHWIDILDADNNALMQSSPGAFGFTPWIDRKRNLIGIFMVQTSGPRVAETVSRIQQKVREAVDACARPVSGVSAASYASTAVAPASITSAFGTSLATGTAVANTAPLPNSLAGTILRVTDAAGKERMASLFFVAPTQINFEIPAGTASGNATLTVTSGDGSLSIGTLPIAMVAPGIFTADATGRGLAAATILRVKSDGSQVYESVARFDAATGRMVAVPVEVGAAGEQVYLILFGTGLRNRSALAGVTASIGGANAPVVFAGAQGGLVGLDQVNLLLPASLAGRGEVDLVINVDGKTANTVRLAFK